MMPADQRLGPQPHYTLAAHDGLIVKGQLRALRAVDKLPQLGRQPAFALIVLIHAAGEEHIVIQPFALGAVEGDIGKQQHLFR